MQRKEMQRCLTDFFDKYPVGQSDLAREAGVSVQTINEITLGKNPEMKMRTKTVVKIGNAIERLREAHK